MAVHQTVIFVLVVIIACNAVLYPSLFSTIFKMWFGSTPPKQESEPMPEYPPHLRGRMPTGARGGDAAAAYMARQRQEGSSNGMMGTILPVYAVGIFIYFGYVIYKIFLKEKPPQEQRTSWSQEDQDNYGPTLEREQEEKLHRQLAAELRAANYDGMGGHMLRRSKVQEQSTPSEDSTSEAKSPRSPTSPRADGDEVDVLKRRLNETERTMDKMMEMMNNMGVAFNRVTEQLNIKTDKPAKQRQDVNKEVDEGEMVSSEEGEDSWSEGSEVIEGQRVTEDGSDDEEGKDERVEDLKESEVGGDVETVRRRNITAGGDVKE
ncbi:uncharacterized protein [Apostichopus japonicus]|uniref:uncharacterized protein isoform X2 n=1 Tax=Stichopus japonicus TaxID=307972 RepID=UPI003AB439C8